MSALSLNTLIALKAADAAVKACTYLDDEGGDKVDFGRLLAEYPEVIRFIVRELAGEGADSKPLSEVIDYIVGNLDGIMERFAHELGEELTPRLESLASTLVTVVGSAKQKLTGESADPNQADTASGA